MEPYTQEISRANKACFLFLLDQSFSMEEPLGGSDRRKEDELASVMNAWLQSMVIRASGDEGIKDWIDVGVLGYRTDQQATPILESALQGELGKRAEESGEELFSVVDIGAHPAREDDVIQQVPDDEAGEIIEISTKMQVWVDPVAEGGTPMCHVLYHAFEVVEKWIEEHPKSFPPIVINITDGESQDGDPIPYAGSLKELATENGNVLLFNCHLSVTAADPFMFPASNEILPDELARVLFEMSSPLPDPIFNHALEEGYELKPNARGMAFNADMVALIKFLDMGTRPAATLR